MAMVFITNLLLQHLCIEIWVIINRFIQMALFIPLKNDKMKAQDLALIFTENI
jgi:hypothetical protein